jgi:hypothetical protein
MFENVHFNNSERAFLGGKICKFKKNVVPLQTEKERNMN